MAFWGIEVKPGKPYTHSSKNSGGRLRISQATLAIGKATLTSLVQCNVGDKRPILLCALLPNKIESLQLDLEFDEAEDVMFSVVGPRGVYLTGYYVGNRRSNMQDDSESFGEDIANSGSRESNHSTDEEEYEDSFINDDEPETIPPSPVSSIKDDDDEGDLLKSVKGNGRYKRLKKRNQAIESDDEMSAPEIEDEDDLQISSLCKKNKSQTLREKANTDTLAKVDDSKDKVDVCAVDEKPEGKDDQLNSPIACLDEVTPKRKSKRNKKKQESPKEKKAAEVLAAKDDQKPNAMGEVSTVVEVDSEKNLKNKKKRKGRGSEVNVDGTDNMLHAGNKIDGDQLAIDKSSGVDSNQFANGNQSDEKKAKKKRKKASKTQDFDENANTEPESLNKKTLSNGLVIEDLVTGNDSKGKVAAAGRKVKVQYVVKLKENGQVIDSNNNTPHKFRLGDNEVIEGLNVGLEGMRVGDRRRLTIPPSMSLGYKGDGENVPPNSWLVYDVEMTSIH